MFDDAQVKLHRSRPDPSKPVLVQVEGTDSTEDQIQMCRHRCARLNEEMDFRVASFRPTLLPHGHAIMAPIIENIPALPAGIFLFAGLALAEIATISTSVTRCD
jgi:hypothetical protein